MADDTGPLVIMGGEPDGYCDPDTGACILPGSGQSADESAGPSPH
ncbi:hypothetical protein [Amycolatopsis saalfeldensis]|nr:hypothetical protein [Amycolatopsis saalfeldensis]